MSSIVVFRILIIFMSINAMLAIGGYSVDTTVDGQQHSNLTAASYTSTTDTSSPLDMIWDWLSMIVPVIDFFFGGGVIGVLRSAGMPAGIQMLVGVPIAALGYYLVIPAIKGLAGLFK